MTLRRAPAEPRSTDDRPQRKVEMTLARITRAAKEVFGEKGLDATTMDNIAERAKLSKQLLYHYFGTKKELYNCVIDEIGQEGHSPILDGDYDGLDADSALRAYFDNIFVSGLRYENNFGLDQMLHGGENLDPTGATAKLGQRITNLLATLLERGRQKGFVRTQASAQEIYLMGMLLSYNFMTARMLMTRYLGTDFTSDEAISRWRKLSIETIMLVIRNDTPLDEVLPLRD